MYRIARDATSGLLVTNFLASADQLVGQEIRVKKDKCLKFESDSLGCFVAEGRGLPVFGRWAVVLVGLFTCRSLCEVDQFILPL